MSHNLLFLGHGLFFIWSLVIDKITVENLYLRILIEEAGHFGQAMVDFYKIFKLVIFESILPKSFSQYVLLI